MLPLLPLRRPTLGQPQKPGDRINMSSSVRCLNIRSGQYEAMVIQLDGQISFTITLIFQCFQFFWGRKSRDMRILLTGTTAVMRLLLVFHDSTTRLCQKDE